MVDPEANVLADAFVSALPEAWAERFRAHVGLDDDLRALWHSSAAAWPAFDPQPQVFARLVARIVDEPAPSMVRELPGPEQYLIAGCLAHDDAALRAFEAEYFGAIDAGLARMRLDPDTLQDVKQKVREKLYVARAEDGVVPLEEYAGRGSMRSFLRVMATRIALNLIRSNSARDRVGERQQQLMPDTAAVKTPELSLLKQTHRDAFEQALAAAAAELSAEERNLLRLHLVDSLTIDELAGLHRIHRATAARRIARVRTKIAERTREILNTRLDLSTGEFTSVVRLVQSQIDVSMRQILRSRTDDSAS